MLILTLLDVHLPWPDRLHVFVHIVSALSLTLGKLFDCTSTYSWYDAMSERLGTYNAIVWAVHASLPTFLEPFLPPFMYVKMALRTRLSLRLKLRGFKGHHLQ